jgi:hypothetical protein
VSDEVIFTELPETFPKFDKYEKDSNANPLPAVAPPPSPPPPPKAAAPAEPVRVGGYLRTPAERSNDPGHSDS